MSLKPVIAGMVNVPAPGVGGASLSTPKVYYVESTGNNATGAVGDPALPYLTGTAAYDAGVAAAVPFVMQFGVGSFTITLSADFDPLCLSVIGRGYAWAAADSATHLSIAGHGAAVANVDAASGFDATVSIDNLFLTLSLYGGDTTVTDADTNTAGNGGNAVITGRGAVAVTVSGGNESPESTDGTVIPGAGGTVVIKGDVLVNAIYTNGGWGYIASVNTPSAAGGSVEVDGGNLRGATINVGEAPATLGTITLGRCSYTSGLTVDTNKGGNAAW